MAKYISVLIEYEDDQPGPSFTASMEVLGGKVMGVMFNDALEKIEQLEDELDEVKRSINT